MSAPQTQALAQAADDAAVDALMKSRNKVEQIEDRSGLLGTPSGTPPADASEDEMHEAYMQTYFPQAARNT